MLFIFLHTTGSLVYIGSGYHLVPHLDLFVLGLGEYYS